jgi:hypothetical protein
MNSNLRRREFLKAGSTLVAGAALASLRPSRAAAAEKVQGSSPTAAKMGWRVGVFLPTLPFYEAARVRRRRLVLDDQSVMIWDAETLAEFKMTFFRRKNLADVEQVLGTQGSRFDRAWVREQLAAMYGNRDPRLSAWDQLVQETPAE